MVISPEAPTTGHTPVDTAVAAARDETTAFFDRDVPLGAAGEVLDQATRVWEHLEQIKISMAARLAQLEATGQLLEQGGQKNLQDWIRHAFGIPAAQANDLALIGRAEFRQDMAPTLQALHSGVLSVGEAAAVIKGADAGVEKRQKGDHPDPELFRAKMECGILDFKESRPNMSVGQITRLAHQLCLRLNPGKAEKDHEAAHAARGAQLVTTFDQTFLLQMWGSPADALKVQVALDNYQVPFHPQDGLSKYERTYDALMAALGFAQSHQGCHTPSTATALINITVPGSSLAGDETAEDSGPATTETGQVVPISVVRELIGQSWVRRLVVEQKSGQVLDVGRSCRLAPPKIRAAAFHGHTSCAWQYGCDVPLPWTQADHIVEFWQGGTTSAANIQPLCATHNQIKHRWAVRTDRRMWSGRNRGRTGNRDGDGDTDTGGDGDPAPAPDP
ncbi:HNH endonuclease signature motif containing protein [Nocardiopsis nanhaiensis]